MSKIRELADKAIVALSAYNSRMAQKYDDELKALDDGWVKCNERLPDKDGCYLICDEHGNQDIAVWFNAAWDGDVDPVFWRELTQPPEDK